jgi:hypothetical protein
MSETPDKYTTAILGSSVSRRGEGWRCIRFLSPLREPRAAPPRPKLRNNKCMLRSPAARPRACIYRLCGWVWGGARGGNRIHRHLSPGRLPDGPSTAVVYMWGVS